MAEVILENLVKDFSDGKHGVVRAVNEINLIINDREFMVLVGPSGCGKSTSLRMIAGLEEVSSGTISIDGRQVNNVLPKDRDIAMVFQNYALYPHMSVFDNMAFGLKLMKYPKAEIRGRVLEAARILGIEDLLEKILLQAELLELRANPSRPARGTVIEAELDQGMGPVATVLLEAGTLRVGENFVCGLYPGRVRALLDERGRKVDSAGPSIPIRILGLEGIPQAGDSLVVLS